MTTWKLLILEAMESRDEKWADVVASTFDDGEENDEFDESYGGEEGIAFTLWTDNFVYFPACYDGSEWVSSVPRNPCEIKTSHVGG